MVTNEENASLLSKLVPYHRDILYNGSSVFYEEATTKLSKGERTIIITQLSFHVVLKRLRGCIMYNTTCSIL